MIFFKNQLVTASGSGEDSQQTNLFKKRLGEHISTWKQLKGLREVNSPEDPQTWQWKQGFWEDEFSLQEGDFLPSMPSTSPWVRTDRARSMHSGSSSQGSMKPPYQIAQWKFQTIVGEVFILPGKCPTIWVSKMDKLWGFGGCPGIGFFKPCTTLNLLGNSKPCILTHTPCRYRKLKTGTPLQIGWFGRDLPKHWQSAWGSRQFWQVCGRSFLVLSFKNGCYMVVHW